MFFFEVLGESSGASVLTFNREVGPLRLSRSDELRRVRDFYPLNTRNLSHGIHRKSDPEQLCTLVRAGGVSIPCGNYLYLVWTVVV